MGYQDSSRRNSSAPKPLIVGQIHQVNTNAKATFAATASAQEVMSAASGNFINQGGVSWDGLVTPFQLGTSSTKLPVMPNSAGTECRPTFTNHVDPPINEYTPPTVNIGTLNPFTFSAPYSDTTNHYDGTILFNDTSANGQNIPNLDAEGASVPTSLRPMALRGPLIIQGWGYDMQGKPIPNKVDSASSARAGIFASSNLKDKFIDNMLESRETWPVAPLDLRYDRSRKVWTVPSTFRIIKATAKFDIDAGSNGVAVPSNINPVYDADGAVVDDRTITVDNPSFGGTITSGEQFFTFYDTSDCKYYPLRPTSCINANRLSGCYNESDEPDTYVPYNSLQIGSGLKGVPYSRDAGCDGSGLKLETMHKFSGEYFTDIVPGLGLVVTDNGCGSFTISTESAEASCPTISGEGTVTVTKGAGCDFVVSGAPSTNSITIVKATGCASVTGPAINGNERTYTVSGHRTAITGQGSITAVESGECGYIISGCEHTFSGEGGITVTSDGCDHVISGCLPTVTQAGDITVTTDGECGYIVSGCDPVVAGEGSNTVTVSTVGGCKTYTVSGCQDNFIGVGSVTVTSTAQGKCKEYTISGCETELVGQGNVTVTPNGDCGYIVSGCTTLLAGGDGINVTPSGECGYKIDFDGCRNTVASTDSCIIVNEVSVGDCSRFDLSLDPSCTSFVGNILQAGDISVTKAGNVYTVSGCNPVIAGGTNVTVNESTSAGCKTYTVDASGCKPSFVAQGGVSITDVGDYCNQVVTISGCQDTFTQAGTVTITSSSNGDCKDYTISGCAPDIEGIAGISVTKAAGDCGKITISGNYIDGTAPQYKDTSYCDYTASTTSCTEIACLTLGEGLQLAGTTVSAPLLDVEGDWVSCVSVAASEFPATKILFSDNISTSRAGCVWTVKAADQKIKGDNGACGQGNVAAATDFTELNFSSNLGVSMGAGADACKATIVGLDQKIKAENGACGQGDVAAATDFTELNFSDNIGVEMGAGDDACKATIKGLDQKISSTRNAAVTNCMAQGADVAETDFKKLAFTDNIGVSVADCVATIKGLDQKVSSTRNAAVTNCMAQGADVAATDFTTIAFTDNIGVSVNACTATVKGLDQKVSSTRNAAVTNCMGQGADVAATDFTTIAFTDNIGVSVDACTATVKGLDQNIKGTANALIAGSETFDNQNFTKLTFSDNIGVDQTDCSFEIKGLDQKIAAGNGNCASNFGATDFTQLTFNHGLEVQADGAGAFTINRKSIWTNHAGANPAGDYVCEVKPGCGVDFELDGTAIKIKLDPTKGDAGEQTVQLVKDICCQGNGFDIKYTTLTFSSCGLLKSITEGAAC